MAEPAIAVAAPSGDELSDKVARLAEARGSRVLRLPLETLADVVVTLDGDTMFVEGEPIGGIVFRGDYESQMSGGFVVTDQRFTDLEAGAVWLAALHLPTVEAINRPDATGWFEGGWSTWRAALATEGVSLAPLHVGEDPGPDAAWFPYTGRNPRRLPPPEARGTLAVAWGRPRTELICCCGVSVGAKTKAATGIARALDDIGLALASVQLDASNRVCSVNPHPIVDDAADLNLVSERIVDRLTRRRRRR